MGVSGLKLDKESWVAGAKCVSLGSAMHGSESSHVCRGIWLSLLSEGQNATAVALGVLIGAGAT